MVDRSPTAETIVLIRIPNPLADNVFANSPGPDGNSGIAVVDPLSGIVIIVDPASAEENGPRRRAVKHCRYSPLWRSLLSRRLASASAEAGSAISSKA
jgi:hypothetical protein